MMRKGRGSQAGLGYLIEGLLKQSGLQKRFRQSQVMLGWKEIVGSSNARHSWPLRLRDGVLIVGCSSAGWAQTLTMLKAQIMEKIAVQFGDCPLKEIQFRGIGKPDKSDFEERAPVMLPAKIALPVEEMEWVRQLTSSISDAQLRQKAEAALGSLLRQRKWHECQGNKICPRCGRLHRTSKILCDSCLRRKQA